MKGKRPTIRGDKTFQDLADLHVTYYDALEQKQPSEPYALAGYSYGGMVAFELAKKIEAAGDKVNWTGCLLQVAFFCDLFSEDRADELAPEIRPLPKSEQRTRVMGEANPARRAELGITLASLNTWADVTSSLANIGRNYDLSGTVSCMNVFFCDPLRGVAVPREEYRYTQLNRWEEFVRNDLKFHEVDGQYYTMISPERVPKFQQKLKDVLYARGLSFPRTKLDVIYLRSKIFEDDWANCEENNPHDLSP
ncbi:hypothetical protein AAEP93_007364 [Penicillium crustosum]